MSPSYYFRRSKRLVLSILAVVLGIGALAIFEGIYASSLPPYTGNSSVAEADDNFRLSSQELSHNRSDELIKKVLGAQPSTFGDLIHRWRVNAASQHPNAALLEDVRPLTSFKRFHELYANSPPVIHRTNTGWQVRTARRKNEMQDGWQSQFHPDQLLATLAEIGAPIDLEIEAGSSPIHISDLLASSKNNFVFGQECDWSLLAYALYQPEEVSWTNRFGESCSLRAIVAKLLDDDLGSGPCAGTHHQITFAQLLKGQGGTSILNVTQRRKIEAFLSATSRKLEESQHTNGAWDYDWAKGNAHLELERSADQFDSLVQVTAHHLEWMCRVPNRLRPSDATCRQAARFVMNAVNNREPADMVNNYCGYSHAACALALLSAHN